jgi:hypothetical protein
MATFPTAMTTARRLDVRTVAVLVSLVLAASAPAPARAATAPAPKGPTLALSATGGSAANLLRGRPGRVLRGSVTVSNVSRHRIAVRLQPADVPNATNGNADYITTTPFRRPAAGCTCPPGPCASPPDPPAGSRTR